MFVVVVVLAVAILAVVVVVVGGGGKGAYGVGGGRAAVKEVVVGETVEATATISTTYQCGHKSSFES